MHKYAYVFIYEQHHMKYTDLYFLLQSYIRNTAIETQIYMYI